MKKKYLSPEIKLKQLSPERKKELEGMGTLTIAEFAELKGIHFAGLYGKHSKLLKYPGCLDTEGKPTRIINNYKVKRFNIDMRTKKKYEQSR